MNYVLLSGTGNLIDSYGEEAAARAALQRIVDGEPQAAEDVALMTYDEKGQPVGDPIFASALSAVR